MRESFRQQTDVVLQRLEQHLGVPAAFEDLLVQPVEPRRMVPELPRILVELPRVLVELPRVLIYSTGLMVDSTGEVLNEFRMMVEPPAVVVEARRVVVDPNSHLFERRSDVAIHPHHDPSIVVATVQTAPIVLCKA